MYIAAIPTGPQFQMSLTLAWARHAAHAPGTERPADPADTWTILRACTRHPCVETPDHYVTCSTPNCEFCGPRPAISLLHGADNEVLRRHIELCAAAKPAAPIPGVLACGICGGGPAIAHTAPKHCAACHRILPISSAIFHVSSTAAQHCREWAAVESFCTPACYYKVHPAPCAACAKPDAAQCNEYGFFCNVACAQAYPRQAAPCAPSDVPCARCDATPCVLKDALGAYCSSGCADRVQVTDVLRTSVYEAPTVKWVQCARCERWMHATCGMANVREYVYGDPNFACPVCCPQGDGLRLTARRVFAETPMSKWIEAQLPEGVQHCTVRQLACEKEYTCIGLFQAHDGVDVLVFVMYMADILEKKAVHLSYLDSVPFFEPKAKRTETFYAIILGYLGLRRRQGYMRCYVHACPPNEAHDTYIFYVRPPDQKVLTQTELLGWYKALVQRGKEKGILAEQRQFDKNTDWDLVRAHFDGLFRTYTPEQCTKGLTHRPDLFTLEFAPGSPRAQVPPVLPNMAATSIFSDRHALVSRFTRYHLVFNTMISAKYTTLMLMHAVAHPDATHAFTCDECGGEVMRGARYGCPRCPNIDLCTKCRVHSHPLHPVFKRARSDET